MAFVERYGNTISQNGWPMVDEAECEWIVPARTNVHLQIRKGDAATILGAFASRFDQTVEPLRDDDSACWTPTNDVPTSNHMAGTACDFNWNSHPFHVEGTFGDRIPAVHALLDEFKGCVEWGGECWGGNPTDDMHFQLAHPEGDQQIIDLANELRARQPLPEEPHRDRYIRDIIAEGHRRGITERGIEIALATALVESNITMYANERVPESMGIPHEAVGSDAFSVGIFQQQVRDTGNGWWWGDAQTCMDSTLSAGLFYDRLAKLDYNNTANSPGSYAQTVQQSAYPDRYDERFDEASHLYYQFGTEPPAPPAPAPPQPGSEMLSQEDRDRMLTDIWTALYELVPSKSRYGDPSIKWYRKDLITNMDGFTYDAWVENNAKLGDPEALAQIRAAAGLGDKIAARFLSDLFSGSTPPIPAPEPLPTPVHPVQPGPVVGPFAPPPQSLEEFKSHVRDSENGATESTSLAAASDRYQADVNRLTADINRLIG